MDHGGHHDSPMPDMPPMSAKCSMSMLWNWNVADTCVIFESWHIHSSFQMFLSCLVVVLLAFSYEALKAYVALKDRRLAAQLVASHFPQHAAPAPTGRSSPVPWTSMSTPLTGTCVALPVSVRTTRAISYALSVFLSFFLMLVFMTYNGYLIAATVIGAGVGHYVYNRELDPFAVLGGGGAQGKALACH